MKHKKNNNATKKKNRRIARKRALRTMTPMVKHDSIRAARRKYGLGVGA